MTNLGPNINDKIHIQDVELVDPTDQDLEKALLQICGRAENATDAEQLLEALGYLSYEHPKHYSKNGQLLSENKRSIGMSETNGYLEKRSQLV